MDWLKKAPTPVIVSVILTVAVMILGSLGGFIALAWAGKPTDDYRAFINTLANLITVPMTGGALWFAAAGARSASSAEDNTNGALGHKDAEIRDLNARLRSLTAQNLRAQLPSQKPPYSGGQR